MNDIISTALSGLTAARQTVRISASNIANQASAGTTDGRVAAYSPLRPVANSTETGGVQVTGQPVRPATTAVFSPDSPLADDQGFIAAPADTLINDLVTLKTAETSYKASARLIEAARDLDQALLDATDDREG